MPNDDGMVSDFPLVGIRLPEANRIEAKFRVQGSEFRVQKAESRRQKAESRKQKAQGSQ
jgi:hypothetical protein